MRYLKNFGIIVGLFAFPVIGIAATIACSDISTIDVAEPLGKDDWKMVGVEGQDDRKSEARDVSGFTGVDIGYAMTATITVGQSYEVLVETKAEFLPKVITEVRNETLYVKIDQNWWKQIRGKYRKTRINLKISLPELKDLDISGASKAKVAGVNSDRLTVDISGASNVSIEGSARSLNIDLSGASNLKAGNLISDTAKMDLSGASSAKVNVSSELDVDASGASSVCYAGSPRVTKDTSGASSVRNCGTA